MAATQMNIRIDTELKSRGDAVLKDMSITPSQAVRWLWEFLDTHADNPEALRCFRGSPDNVVFAAQVQSGDSYEEMQASHAVINDVQAFRRSLGLEGIYNDTLSDKELLEEALYDRLLERVLI